MQSEANTDHQSSTSCSFTPDYIDQAISTLDGFYPRWKVTIQLTDHDTIIIPACLDVQTGAYHGSVDSCADGFVSKKFDDAKRRLRGRNGEEIFVRAFKDLKLGGILISGFDTHEFVKEMNRQGRSGYKAKDTMKRWMKQGRHFETDCIFIHGEMGIFIIEIKALDNESDYSVEKKKYSEARSQLDKIIPGLKKIYLSLFHSDKDVEIPFHNYVCFPLRTVSKETDAIDESVVKCAEKFREQFISKMNWCFSSGKTVQIQESFLKFTAALVGYRSVVNVSNFCNSIEIAKLVTSQEYLSLGGTCGQTRQLKRIISDTDDSRTIFLHAKQIEILECEERFICISGPPGTGKTMLVLMAAIEAAKVKKTGKVILMTGNERHIAKLQQIIDANNDGYKRIPVIYGWGWQNENRNQIKQQKLYEFLKSLAEMVSIGNDDLFCDEFAFSNPVIEFLQMRIESSCLGRTFVALTGLWKPSEIVNFDQQVRRARLSLFRYFHLSTVMRGSKNIVQEWASKYPSEIHIGHNISGALVDSHRPKSIKEGIKILEDKMCDLLGGRNKFPYRRPADVVVLIGSAEVKKAVTFLFAVRGINSGTIPAQVDNPNLIAVDYIDGSQSYEWPIVFILIDFSIDFDESCFMIAASRCIAHLVVIETDFFGFQKALDGQLPKSHVERSQMNLNNLREKIQNVETEFGISLSPINKDLHLIWAIVRHNFFPFDIECYQLLKNCNSFTAFLVNAANYDMFEIVHNDPSGQKTNVRYALKNGHSPTKFIKSLWSHVDDQEQNERWDCFKQVFNRLFSSDRHDLFAITNDEPSSEPHIVQLAFTDKVQSENCKELEILLGAINSILVNCYFRSACQEMT